jgi:hypothetical protein
MTPVRNAEVLKAWADGAAIQWRHADFQIAPPWQDYVNYSHDSPNVADTRYDWRIKPTTLRYRNYLYDLNGTKHPNVITEAAYSALRIDGNQSFVRWLDGWQEVEL